ncbi:16S rRNA (cytosine(967)-C(5))-methyltransferase RsmB [Ostreibacterium oceani]|uniref:16S rRNA (cytosine(967)-C(5))-methyltransferase RsmB n=1 Tax=Ostreibacterium oceani TaxID=2654998 RepID=UPI00128B53AC|nr:16S rRNA (cytosine(967)-C(5))-methyltransferase RsmB [Ostreibacterium oceani]
MTVYAADDAISPRLAAVYAINDVINSGQSLRYALSKNLEKIATAADKGLCHEITYGTLRYYPSLVKTLRPYLKKNITKKNQIVKILLVSALYQLIQLKLPSYAVINESVALCKSLNMAWATGFANAVLRRIAGAEDLAKDSVKYSAKDAAKNAAKDAIMQQDDFADHPTWLWQRIQRAYPDKAETLLAANHQPAPMMLRVHDTARFSQTSYLAALQAAGIDAAAHIDAKAAIVLAAPVAVSQLPFFDEGAVTVQDANAQLAANLLGVKAGHHVLDACAAPGGKTAHIATKASPITLTAVEIDPTRSERMRDTLSRLKAGFAHDVTINVKVADLADLAAWHNGQSFDRILLDAPCSATGVIRKHPDILHHRRESDLQALCQLQGQLLDLCWQLLAPGGRLLYATCSVLPEENQQQIARFLQRHTAAKLRPLAHNRTVAVADHNQSNHEQGGVQNPELSGCLQFLPDAWGDGFFYAALEK